MMNYHDTVRLVQPPLDIHFGKRVRRRRAFSLPGGSCLWMASAKIGGALACIVLCLNLLLGSLAGGMNETVREIEAARHQLKDEQIALLAERAYLMSEKEVGKRAGEQLALYVPEEEQVFHLR